MPSNGNWLNRDRRDTCDRLGINLFRPVLFSARKIHYLKGNPDHLNGEHLLPHFLERWRPMKLTLSGNSEWIRVPKKSIQEASGGRRSRDSLNLMPLSQRLHS